MQCACVAEHRKLQWSTYMYVWHADVRCAGIVWTSEMDYDVESLRICGVVDENVPLPLLRAIFRTTPCSKEMTMIWRMLMKDGDDAPNDTSVMYTRAYREEHYLCTHRFKSIKKREFAPHARALIWTHSMRFTHP